MKHEKLYDALEEIQLRHIAEAANYKKKSPVRWVSAIAAILAVAILVGTVFRSVVRPPEIEYHADATADSNPPDPVRPIRPNIPQVFIPPEGQPSPYQQLACFVAGAEYPIMAANPGMSKDGDYDAWRNDQMALHTQPDGYADSLKNFWARLDQSLLSTKGNMTCSPVNIYMALSMLAEITDGQSRQQILDVLGADNIEQLRQQAMQVWQGHYNNDQISISILANSLWLQENYGFNMETAQLLAENYYASVFQGDLGSQEMNDMLKAWLNQETGGLLEDYIKDIEIDSQTVLALASTLYYQVQWVDEFAEKNNTESIFHGANGDTVEEFMNKALNYGPYYWGEHFGAVALGLEDGSRMWLFLPDEGFSPAQIIDEVHAFLQTNPSHSDSADLNKKFMKVNLSVPKFDVSAELDLQDIFKEMGITDIFNETKADFTPILPKNDGGAISEVRHAARVTRDEKGVTAAAFTLIPRAGGAPMPEDEIDFVLDRPFLFVVESSDGLPLFTGTVAEP